MTKEDREEMLADIQRFCLMDDTFFHTCLKDSPAGMEWILRIILDDPELTVLEMHTQEDVPNIYGRAVIFDVFVRDTNGKEYDVEVQRDNSGADPLRARCNASLMDTMNIEKGKKWKDIPPAIVIFITEHDPLHGGKPIYHVRRTIEELDNKRFEDDAAIIYVNASIQNDDTPLGLLMQDFYCKDPEKMHSKVLAERARYFKSDEHGVMKMCEIMEKFAKSYAKGEREEGKSEGKALMMRIFKLLQAKTPFASIAEETKVSLDEVRQIAKDYGIAY